MKREINIQKINNYDSFITFTKIFLSTTIALQPHKKNIYILLWNNNIWLHHHKSIIFLFFPTDTVTFNIKLKRILKL